MTASNTVVTTIPGGRSLRRRSVPASFPNAVSRVRYFIPQSGAGMSRFGGDMYFKASRMRSATCSGVSTAASLRSMTPSMMVLPARSDSTPRSSFGCAASIEIC